MSPLDIDAFMASGYPGNEVEEQTISASVVSDARPSTPTYTVQPVVWMFLTLALCVIGLYFFLED